ncbi:MAG: LamG-like jellyroll fold domain-containing protein, partial [Planctomycetota bacterium]
TVTDPVVYDQGATTRLGAQANGNNTVDLDGMIVDAQVYDRALSAEQIAALVAETTPSDVGPDLTQTFDTPAGDSGAANLLFIHDDFGGITSDGTISALQLAPDSNATPIDLDLLVLRPNGGSNFEVVHRVSLTDSDIVSTDGNGVRTLGVGTLEVQAGDVIAHWSATAGGAIPFSAGTGGSTGWSTYSTSSDLDVGNTVQESLDSSNARVYGLNVVFAASQSQSDSMAITVDAVNDAPTFVQPELVSNGTFDVDLSGWTTTGTALYSTADGGSLRFGEGNNAGPRTAAQTINTIAGATYELSFDYRDGQPDKTQSLQVTVDGASNLLTTPQIITDETGTTYVRYTYSFTADSSTATITFTDTSDTAGVADGTFDVDGFVDNISVQYVSGVMNEVAFVEDGAAVILNSDVEIFDEELSDSDNFSGATLTLVRNGGANVDDVYSFVGGNGLNYSAGTVRTNGQAIATWDATTTPGQLVITFTDAGGEIPTQTHVNNILRQIAYEDTNDGPPATVQIDWTFDDQNSGAQGSGGSLDTTGSTVVNIQNTPDLLITAPPTATTNEDTAFVFAGANVIQVDDGIAADTLTRVSLSVSNGTLSLASTIGITFVEGADGAASIVIEGLESDINTALNGLQFDPNQDYNGADTLTILSAVAGNLDGHYTFEGNADDQSAGTQEDGTLSGTATITNDATRGDVLLLDGAGQVDIGGDFGQPTNVTVTAWVNVDSGAPTGVVWNVGGDLSLRVEGNGGWGLFAAFNDGTQWQNTVSNQMLGGTGWHHVAYSVDDVNNTQTLYVDGVQVAQTTFAQGIADVSAFNGTFIGSNGGGNYFEGMIDDARLYSRALAADEIAALASVSSELNDSVAITIDPVNDEPTFFAVDGVTTQFPTTADWVSELVQQRDGKLVSIGVSDDGVTLTRFNEDGSLDTSFGTAGRATETFGGGATVQGGALQADGKFIVVGSHNNESFVARFDADGSLDLTFDTDGYMTIDLSGASSEYLSDVVVQPDGKIVAVGYANFSGAEERMTIVRLSTDGSLDTTFDTNGYSVLDIGPDDDRFEAVSLDSSGRIVAVGQSINGAGNADVAVLRFNTDGSLDTTLDTDGIATFDIGGGSNNFDSGTAVAIDSSGRIVIGGTTDPGDSESLAMRLLDNGSLHGTHGGERRSTGWQHHGSVSGTG